MNGIKYTNEYQEYIGIKVTLIYDENDFSPKLIVQGKDESIKYEIEYKNHIMKSVDDAVDKFIMKSRKEKLEK